MLRFPTIYQKSFDTVRLPVPLPLCFLLETKEWPCILLCLHASEHSLSLHAWRLTGVSDLIDWKNIWSDFSIVEEANYDVLKPNMYDD